MARDAGFDNVSLDLMMWLPQQSVAEWLVSVDALIALGPGPCVAVPARDVSERAAARRDGARARWSLAPDDDAAEMYLQAMERLDAGRLRAVRDFERGEARASSRATT